MIVRNNACDLDISFDNQRLISHICLVHCVNGREHEEIDNETSVICDWNMDNKRRKFKQESFSVSRNYSLPWRRSEESR